MNIKEHLRRLEVSLNSGVDDGRTTEQRDAALALILERRTDLTWHSNVGGILQKAFEEKRGVRIVLVSGQVAKGSIAMFEDGRVTMKGGRTDADRVTEENSFFLSEIEEIVIH